MKPLKNVITAAIMFLFLTMQGISVSAEPVSGCDLEPDAEARIGTTPYETLEKAVEAANTMEPAEGESVEIILLKDIELDQKITFSKNITISGDYTIYRAKGYTGQMFLVSKDVKLVMRDLTVDGNNKWVFNRDKLMNDVKTMDPVYGGGYAAYVTYEEGAPIANGSTAVMDIVGQVSLESTTFQNHAGASLFWISGTGKLEVTNTLIDHITKSSARVFGDVSAGGTLIINEGTVISNCFGEGNALLGAVYGTAVINGGEICHNGGYDCNGYVFMVKGSSSYCEMNGGYIHDNIGTRGWANGYNCVFYVYGDGATFVMNGGTISDNYSSSIPGIASNGSNAKITLNGGNMLNAHSTRGFVTKDLYAYCNAWINNTVTSAKNGFYRNLTNNGTLIGNAYFYEKTMTCDGTGTINGNVYIRSGAETTFASGTWNGVVTVQAVGNDSTLTVKPGAVITGGPVRVLNHVDSGNSENVAQAAAAQEAAYIEENGAEVNVPVLYYHRLTSAQKSGVVVTYDYNGGLDAQNWSGIQRTGEAPYTMEPLPEPTKPGYVLAGWATATDQDPESLDMSVSEAYVPGTAATSSIRYIAQWTREGEHTVTYVYAGDVPENAPTVPAARDYAEGDTVELPQLGADGYTFSWDTGVLNDGKMPANAVTITGTWTKLPDPVYSATYTYTGDVPDNAPALPAARDYKEGEIVELPQISAEGYTFTWDTGVLNDGKMPANAVTITGTWTKILPSGNEGKDTTDNTEDTTGDTTGNTTEGTTDNTEETTETAPEINTTPNPVTTVNDSASGNSAANSSALVTILDEEIPLSAVPKTGDPFSIWFLIGGISSGALLAVAAKKKKCK